MKSQPLFELRRGVSAIGLIASSLALSACSHALPTPMALPDGQVERNAQIARFTETDPVAVRRVTVPSDTFRPSRADQPITPNTAAKNVNLSFSGQSSMVDLATALSMSGVQLAYAEEGGQTVAARRLPFERFQGTVGELFDTLESASGIVASERNGTVYLGDVARYTVSLPQNAEIMEAAAAEIGSLGATDVITSVQGGQLIYTAQPRINEQRIEPFLHRTAQNLAVVTMQVAVVSLAVNDNSSSGFDWDAFRLNLRNGGGGVPALEEVSPGAGGLLDLAGGGINIGQTVTGEIFGTAAVATFGGAINFLSTFGQTRIAQNVELRTVSGQEVTLRSGQQVPYVSNINTSNNSEGNTSAGTQTDTIETGLTLALQPWFDATTNLVTLDLDLQLNQILQFVELSAGNQIGTLTQPLTQDQSLTDLIRIRAGETVVVGGLQSESSTYSGNEPTFMRDREGSAGSRSQDVQNNALFIIVRPTITIYEPDTVRSAFAAGQVPAMAAPAISEIRGQA